MQYRLLDILADPDNPDHWPLKLNIFKTQTRERKQIPKPHANSGRFCKFYCFIKDSYLVSDPLGKDEKPLAAEQIDKIVTLNECNTCIKTEIVDGIIYHEYEDKTKWFIIDDEIPVMFPLALRDASQEKRFIEQYKDECAELGITEPFLPRDE
ncbi:MAG: hypothetical protein INQ03_24040 [Candidatus Heimdallarchaeota archaeon]|nr:hypothetical protein [Candidatus Heimdallarchaeota archaeon]